jgi:hypothetical protein
MNAIFDSLLPELKSQLVRTYEDRKRIIKELETDLKNINDTVKIQFTNSLNVPDIILSMKPNNREEAENIKTQVQEWINKFNEDLVSGFGIEGVKRATVVEPSAPSDAPPTDGRKKRTHSRKKKRTHSKKKKKSVHKKKSSKRKY